MECFSFLRMIFREIEFGSSDYALELQVRDQVLWRPLKGVAKVYLVGTCGSHVQALNDGRASGSSLPFRSRADFYGGP